MPIKNYNPPVCFCYKYFNTGLLVNLGTFFLLKMTEVKNINYLILN